MPLTPTTAPPVEGLPSSELKAFSETVEVEETGDAALTDVLESDHRALEAVMTSTLTALTNGIGELSALALPTADGSPNTPSRPKAASPSLSTFVASPLSYLQPQSFHRTVMPAAAVRSRASSLFTGSVSVDHALMGGSALPPLSSSLFRLDRTSPTAQSTTSTLLRSSSSSQVQQVMRTLSAVRLGAPVHTAATTS